MDVLRWVWRLGFGLVLSFTIAVSLLPQSEMPSHNISDKLGHFLTYLALGLSGALPLSRLKSKYFFALLVLLACALEVLQGFVPGRSPGFFDALASSLGAAAGILVVSVLRLKTGARVGKTS
jgi:VanZ family protein